MNPRVWIRGMGELGSGVGHLLHRMGFQVIGSELEQPLSIRLPVCFSRAMIQGDTVVDGVRAFRAERLEETEDQDGIPIFIDREDLGSILQPRVLVDARMLKEELSLPPERPPFCIGLGPGFQTGINSDLVVETQRGHRLGALIWSGSAAQNTGIPGELGGKTKERIIRAPARGHIQWRQDFGAQVTAGQVIGTCSNGAWIQAPTNGMLRGMISPDVQVETGMKIGDIDPRGVAVDYRKISDKARLIAYGVLEGILTYQKENHG